MKQASVTYAHGFHVLTGDSHSQAASMVIPPGGSEGGPENAHRGPINGSTSKAARARARVNGHVYPLEAGALMLIQRGDRHEIRNTGSTPLKTLNVYVPPAYTADGEELSAGKS